MSYKEVKPYKVGDPLSPRQEKWIQEYIKTGSPIEATRRAGYKGDPRGMGYQNTVKFKDVIEARKKELGETIKSNNVAELEDIFEFWTQTFTDENVKLQDRIKASELLAKAKGGFIEKREVKVIDTDWFI